MLQNSRRIAIAAGLCAALGGGSGLGFGFGPASARAQTGPSGPSGLTPSIAAVGEIFVPMPSDSGQVTPPSEAEALRRNPGLRPDQLGQVVTYTTQVYLPGATLTRLKFSALSLSGEPLRETGARLKITGIADGAEQWLDADSAAQWAGTSAYFNGPLVQVELYAWPGTAPSRVAIEGAWRDEEVLGVQNICGSDDRTQSFDARQGRLSVGCTGWLINDTNNMFLTAGHCGLTSTTVVSLNVPLSTTTGALVASSPDDQYIVDATSIQFENGGVGRDYTYFGTSVNSNHGLTPWQRAGGNYTLAAAAPAAAAQTIRVTGYGTVSTPMPLTLNQVQTTDTGQYGGQVGTSIRYFVDTTGGNSGSPVVDLTTNLAIGIHTHAGCPTTGNQGTAIQYAPLSAALASPLGICKTGKGTVGGSLYLIGDAANNFGTLRILPDGFGKVAAVGSRWTAMTWDQSRSRFIAINASRDLFAILSDGSMTALGRVGGTAVTLSGLTIDQRTDTVYAVGGTSSQLFRIDNALTTGTKTAVAVGVGQGAGVRAMAFDSTNGVLFALQDQASGTRLLRINPATGGWSPVGALGSGIVTIPALACDQATGALYALNPVSQQLLSINRNNGSATVLGFTGGVFGSNLGLAHRSGILRCPSDIAGGTSPSGTPIGDGVVDGSDFVAFINAFALSDTLADMNGDGSIDGSDFVLFINAFALGC